MHLRLYILLICIGFISIDLGAAEIQHEVLSVMLHTDLVDIIGVNSRCEANTSSTNATVSMRQKLITKQGVVLSKYQFYRMDIFDSARGVCKNVDVKVESFESFNWTCFSTGYNESRDANWFLIDCTNSDSLTTDCFEGTELGEITSALCDTNSDDVEISIADCKEITYGSQRKYAICSKHLYAEKKTQRILLVQDSEVTSMDILAYLCIAFILITFIVTMLIPIEKCKPTYQFDKEKCLRVPLEIYEMYGVKYKPSKRKQLTRKSFNTDKMPTVSFEVDNKIKEELLYGNGEDLPMNNHAFNKIYYNASHQQENPATVAPNDQDTGNDPENDAVADEDSGEYDTIVFPQMEDRNRRTSNQNPDEVAEDNIMLTEGLPYGDMPNIVHEHLFQNIRRHQKGHLRYSQKRSSVCDTVHEEAESLNITGDSCTHETHNERNNTAIDSVYDHCGGVERSFHVRFDDRTLLIQDDRGKQNRKRSARFETRPSFDSDVRNSVTNLSYDMFTDSDTYDRQRRGKIQASSTLRRSARERGSKIIDRTQEDDTRFFNEFDTTSACTERSYDDNSRMRTDETSISEPVYRNTDVEMTDERRHAPQRPRISITVEFPENFGKPSFGSDKRREIGYGSTRISNERNFADQPRVRNDENIGNTGNRYNRSYSVGDTRSKQQKATSDRKFSMC